MYRGVAKERTNPDHHTISPKRRRRSLCASFCFQEHCIFCGESCSLEKDRKNPGRWREAYLCRETGESVGKTPLKQSVLDVCEKRNDKWAASVRERVSGAISDLHAADGRYHLICRTSFMSPRSVVSASIHDAKIDDGALECLIAHVQENQSRTWHSVELFQAYTDYGGTVLSRKQLIKKLSDHFGAHLLVLSSPGIANIIVFRNKASDILRVVDDDDDDLDVAITNVSKTVKADVKRIHVDKGHYSTGIDTESAIQSVSTTVLDLLANLSPKLDKTLPALLIGSMITNTLSNHPTQLQISLGILIRDSKALVKQMHAFGVTCSYDEVLRFKKSAALAATHAIDLAGVSNATTGLVQMIGDNFDADISSQNGKKSTGSHA